MTEQQIINFFKTYKRGCYTKIVKTTQKDGYIKKVVVVGRFVNYYNIKSVKEKATTTAQKKRDYERVIIPHILKLNTNTNNLLLCVYATNHHRAKTTYFYKDKEISEAEYYAGINEKKRDNDKSIVYNFKACDVVALGGCA